MTNIINEDGFDCIVINTREERISWKKQQIDDLAFLWAWNQITHAEWMAQLRPLITDLAECIGHPRAMGWMGRCFQRHMDQKVATPDLTAPGE